MHVYVNSLTQILRLRIKQRNGSSQGRVNNAIYIHWIKMLTRNLWLLGQAKHQIEDIWHQKMGHPNSKFLHLLDSKNMINVNKWSNYPSNWGSCQMGKSCNLSFNLRNKIESEPLNKIHCVLWGPAPISSFQGMRYYVIFADDFSIYSYLYLLKKIHISYTHFWSFKI